MADVVRVLAAIAALFLTLMALLGAVYWTAFRRVPGRRSGPCVRCRLRACFPTEANPR